MRLVQHDPLPIWSRALLSLDNLNNSRLQPTYIRGKGAPMLDQRLRRPGGAIAYDDQGEGPPSACHPGGRRSAHRISLLGARTCGGRLPRGHNGPARAKPVERFLAQLLSSGSCPRLTKDERRETKDFLFL